MGGACKWGSRFERFDYLAPRGSLIAKFLFTATCLVYTNAGSRGVKRPRSEEDAENKVDPRDVPDPEAVEGWDDSSAKALTQERFVILDESTIDVTLDPSKAM